MNFYKLTSYGLTSHYVIKDALCLTYKIGSVVRPVLENSYMFFYAYPEVVTYMNKISADFLNKRFIVRVKPKNPIWDRTLQKNDYRNRTLVPCISNNSVDHLQLYWNVIHALLQELDTDLQDENSAYNFRKEFYHRYFNWATFGNDFLNIEGTIIYLVDTYYSEPACYLAQELEVLFLETPETYARDTVHGHGWHYTD